MAKIQIFKYIREKRKKKTRGRQKGTRVERKSHKPEFFEKFKELQHEVENQLKRSIKILNLWRVSDSF